jgi:hypothetical protein
MISGLHAGLFGGVRWEVREHGTRVGGHWRGTCTGISCNHRS